MATLDPTDYWKLRASSMELERDHQALQAAQTRFEAVRAKHAAYWQTIAAKYQLDPGAPYTARDEDCSLTNGQPAPGA